MGEARRSKFAIHPRSINMYPNLKRTYWWKGLKNDVAQFLTNYIICQKVKPEHRKPVGLLQALPVVKWKRDNITKDFVQ